MVTSVGLYLLFLAALLGERAVELVVTRRHARAALAAGGIESGRGLYRAMVVFHALFPFACAAEVVALRRPFTALLGFPALAAAGAAQGLRWWAATALGPRWNTRVIVVTGAPPVTRGPYRYVRHPNYLAVVAEMVAVPLVHGAWLTALVFSLGNAILLTARIRDEERALGPAWASAFAGVPCLLPGVRRG
jgi:methyltransferase